MLPTPNDRKPTLKSGTPDHEDVNIILKLYELRREAVMRQARDAMAMWTPTSYEEFVAVTQWGHPHNAHFRQVSSYWEMCATFVNQGALHEDLFWQTNGEAIFFFARVEPYIERYRKEIENPGALKQLEELIKRRPDGPGRLAMFKSRIAKMSENAKKAK